MNDARGEMPPGVPVECRSCAARDLLEVLELGRQPVAGYFPTPDEAPTLATWPLTVAVCRRCWLLQLLDPAPDESAPLRIEDTLSSTMSDHAERFVDDVLSVADRSRTRLLEVASHGGHLAPRFAARGVRTLIIDPSVPLIRSATERGLEGEATSLTPEAAAEIREAHGGFDVIIDSYLLAHQRRLDPQLAAMAMLLSDRGSAVLEFNHLLPLLRGSQFDAIRHGHFSYLSLTTLTSALERHGLHAIRATAQPAYGGGVRLWAARRPPDEPDAELAQLMADEADAGIGDESTYRQFAISVGRSRQEIRDFLAGAEATGRKVVGYGAPSRGSTLLNACGITPDLLRYTVDASPAKHGRVMPGSGVPIFDPARIRQDRPDDVLILTWDLADEVVDQLSEIRAWGGRFVTPFPRVSFR